MGDDRWFLGYLLGVMCAALTGVVAGSVLAALCAGGSATLAATCAVIWSRKRLEASA